MSKPTSNGSIFSSSIFKPGVIWMDDFFVEVRDVSKTYGSGAGMTAALAGIDLGVGAGEFVAVMGRSGSGKTTLLNLLAGLDRPTAGSVWLDGIRIDQLSESELAKLRRRKVGFVFQFFNLIRLFTAGET